jgi:hypothetical protein
MIQDTIYYLQKDKEKKKGLSKHLDNPVVYDVLVEAALMKVGR